MSSSNERDQGSNNGPTFNNPFGSNSFPTPTASWTQLSPGYDDRRYSSEDDRRYSSDGGEDKLGSSHQTASNPFNFGQQQGFDPFEQMAKE